MDVGGTAQITRTATLAGRDNHLIAGGGIDVATPRFAFSAERARLTATRGTTRGSGVFEEDAAVDLHVRRVNGGCFYAPQAMLRPLAWYGVPRGG